LAKAQQVRDLLVGGVSIKIEAQSFGGSVNAVEFAAGGTSYRFDASAMSPRPLIWSAQGSLPQASVTFFKDTAQISKIETQGPWALFRLIDKARKENAGPQTFLATFGEGDATAVFRISLPSERNPFSRGGLWSFRCPTVL
jgi:type VI secretion system protein ImpL